MQTIIILIMITPPTSDTTIIVLNSGSTVFEMGVVVNSIVGVLHSSTKSVSVPGTVQSNLAVLRNYNCTSIYDSCKSII